MVDHWVAMVADDWVAAVADGWVATVMDGWVAAVSDGWVAAVADGWVATVVDQRAAAVHPVAQPDPWPSQLSAGSEMAADGGPRAADRRNPGGRAAGSVVAD